MGKHSIRVKRRGRGWIVAALALYWTLGTTVQAQDATKPGPSKMMAKGADPDWEVATVKPSDPNDSKGQHINFRGRNVLLMDTTLEQFLLLGYGIQSSQLAGDPDWAKTQKWHVDGVPDTEGLPSLPQTQALIRKILAERFGLQVHHEQREMPVFALTVAKGGPKVVANTSDPNGWMNQQNGTSNGVHTEDLKNASMAELAFILQFRLDRPWWIRLD